MQRFLADSKYIRHSLRLFFRFACVCFCVAILYLTVTGKFRESHQLFPVGALFFFGLFGIIMPAMIVPSIAPVPLAKIRKGNGRVVIREYFSLAFFLWVLYMSISTFYFLFYAITTSSRGIGILSFGSTVSALALYWVLRNYIKGNIKSGTLYLNSESISIVSAKNSSYNRNEIKHITLNDSLFFPSVGVSGQEHQKNTLASPGLFMPYLTIGPRRIAKELSNALQVPLEVVA